MFTEFLYRKKQFQFSLSRWQILTIAGFMLLLPYTAWEIFWYCKVGADAIKIHTWIAAALVFCWLFTIPVPLIRFIRNTLLLGVVYLILCSVIGEVHPFTKMPMYNKFVNYAYSFKVTDNHGHLVPLKTYYKINSGALAHKYFTIAGKYGFKYGFNLETPETLQLTGRELLKELQESKITNPPADSLCLYLVSHSMFNDSIIQNERFMYAAKVE